MTKAADLKVGDLVRITKPVTLSGSVSGQVPRETRRVWKKLAQRRWPVRIYEIDEYGTPWYRCRFRRNSGGWEHHWLAVMDADANWRLVRRKLN
ncbi:MAG TPA: hypothetical protein VG826_14380 [Pirellulales bacterium]|nr:hypothetical protein [Pirellulales bacterium]